MTETRADSADADRAPRAFEKRCARCSGVHDRTLMICPHCGVRQGKPVSKAVLLLLTFFLGGIGVHRFYLSQPGKGLVYLLFFWTGVPGLVAFIEFVIFIFTPTQRLNEKYETSGTAVAIALAVVLLVFGILAAISIPAYRDYQLRMQVSQVNDAVRLYVTDYVVRTGTLPVQGDLDLPRPPEWRVELMAIDFLAPGVVRVTFDAPAAGETMIYTATITPEGSLHWDCTGGTLRAALRSPHCRP